MNVLSIKAYFFPESLSSSYLTNDVIDELVKRGHTIELITPFPSRGIADKTRDEYKNKLRETKYNGNLKIHRFNTFKEPNSTLFRAIRYCINSFFFVLFSIFKKFDVINIGSTPPIMGITAVIIKMIKNTPIVYNLQDVFPDSAINSGIIKKNSIIYFVSSIIERITYKYVDRIIVISSDIKKNILKKGVVSDKIEIIYNWVDEKAVVPIPKFQNSLFDKLNLSRDNFYVVYAGNLGHAQNIDVILEAAALLMEFSDIRFCIFGREDQSSNYVSKASKLELSNVLFFPLQPYELVSNVYSLGDVSLVTCKPGFGKSGMPSKTWSIMSAARPVIANFDENSELQSIIEENNAGIFTKADDAKALLEAILNLYSNPKQRDEMGRNGRDFILNNLTRDIGARKYVNVIESVAKDFQSKNK